MATFLEVIGDERDLDGLIECVFRTFGITAETETLDETEDPRVRFEDDSDAMAHAFARGLAMYVRGFVASKVDGTLRILEDVEHADDSGEG